MRINVQDLMFAGLNAQQAFEQAFRVCLARPVLLPNVGTLTASGVVYVPAGVYELTASLEIPLYVHLEGEGQTSVLAFSNGGLELPRQVSDPDENGQRFSTLTYSANRIHDLSVVNTNPGNHHAGFDMMGGAGVQIERVYSLGWRNHYLLDQAALVTIDQCHLGGIAFDGEPPEHENGVVFQDPPREPITVGGSANVNSISRCFFNLGGNPVVFKGDVMLTIDRCYVNGGASMIVGGRRASILYCTFESIRSSECILVDSPGTGAIGLEITGCFFAKDISAVRFNTEAVLGFSFNGNLANTSSRPVEGLPDERHVVENQPGRLQGPLIMLGNMNWDAPMVAHEGSPGTVMLYGSSAFSVGDGHRDRVGVGTIQPRATLDIFGGDQTASINPMYGLTLRSEIGTLFRVPMVWPPAPPDHD